ncbi:phosphocholine cytidylyltransferase family protein [Nitrosomonas communis]|uniref:phosphocholine cytidylyltransferase family protein n=1 Tax=Nitrosomonas communis TaxID=44574 RepID=UPI0026EFAC77|nr:phosphocholine cytidylyltransferase family protein [Nitrosomonas communis]MCO6426873.1 phosphocholine cytidylyltransferase family protein [Nitrosomonas communis]
MSDNKSVGPVKAIILSAGQGRRLLPLTENTPKCLLPVFGTPVIAWQIDALLQAGIEDVTVIAGFQVGKVEALLAERYPHYPRVKTLFNPFYEVADNLASCWIARDEMSDNFLLLNGDTLFDAGLLSQVFTAEKAPITLCVDFKQAFDEDDMKVQLDADGWVKQVSKVLTAEQTDAESIGLIYFREQGVPLFRDAVERALRDPRKLKSWYLTIIDMLAQQRLVNACSVHGFHWCEIDFIDDLRRTETLFTVEGGALKEGSKPATILRDDILPTSI